SGRHDVVHAALAVPLIYLGFVCFGAYDVVSAGYYFEGRTYLYSLTVLAATLMNVGLNVGLARSFGLWASSWADAGAYLLFLWLSYVFGRRYFRPGYERNRLAFVVLLTAVVCGAALLTRGLSLGLRVPLAVVVVAAYPTV